MKLREFFQEDNGRFSSMRLILVATALQVHLFQVGCIFWPTLGEQAIPFYSYAAAVVGMKAFQKTKEEESPP